MNSVIIYVSLIALMRLIGKRQLGELELSELIVTVLITEAASEPITDPEMPLRFAFVPMLTLILMEYLLSVISLKSVRLRLFLSGQPALLVAHGKIDQTQMRKNRITPDELAEALRSCGILDMSEVEYAVLETNGQINIIPLPAQRPATAAQVGADAPDTGYPFMVINNGRILSDNLRLLGYDEIWLAKRLQEKGLSSPNEVFMMTADQSGGVYIVPRQDQS